MKTEHRHRKEHSFRRRRVLQKVVGLAAVLGGIGGLVYLSIAGRTGRWPEARDCTVVGSRVVQDVIGTGGPHAFVVWWGEYRVQYEVNGKQYFTWASAGLLDSDRNWVESRIDDYRIDCPVRVQYNPKDPAQSVTHPVRR